MTSPLLTIRASAGAEVNISFSNFPGRGENARNRMDANQAPAKTLAVLLQAKIFRNPSFFKTRSLKSRAG